jgi:hypothetical protein
MACLATSSGLVDGGLQAEPRAEKVAGDAVEEFLAAVFLLGCGPGMNPAGESFAAD